MGDPELAQPGLQVARCGLRVPRARHLVAPTHAGPVVRDDPRPGRPREPRDQGVPVGAVLPAARVSTMVGELPGVTWKASRCPWLLTRCRPAAGPEPASAVVEAAGAGEVGGAASDTSGALQAASAPTSATGRTRARAEPAGGRLLRNDHDDQSWRIRRPDRSCRPPDPVGGCSPVPPLREPGMITDTSASCPGPGRRRACSWTEPGG